MGKQDYGYMYFFANLMSIAFCEVWFSFHFFRQNWKKFNQMLNGGEIFCGFGVSEWIWIQIQEVLGGDFECVDLVQDLSYEILNTIVNQFLPDQSIYCCASSVIFSCRQRVLLISCIAGKLKCLNGRDSLLSLFSLLVNHSL